MKLEWDFSEFERFANNLDNLHDFNTAIMTATQNIAKILHQYLLTNTPVDTGNLRKMWSAGDNLRFTVEPILNGYEVTLINLAQNKDFRYGLAVNDGHKTPYGDGWVMGRFFVEKSIIQTGETSQLQNIIMEQLQKWWDSV